MEEQAPSISAIVKAILDQDSWTKEALAAELGISSSTIARWYRGDGEPRPLLEHKLRSIYNSVNEERARYSSTSEIKLDLAKEAGIRSAIDAALHELREAFHRRSRLSGRSEALDEVTKLLFAHVVGLANDGRGIDQHLLNSKTANPVIELRRFVRSAFEKYLTRSLNHELPTREFDLRLKTQEHDLAIEIINSFDRLSNTPGLVSENGIEAVDLLNEVFGKFLADSFVDEKQLGQYLTPTEVVRFMVQLGLNELDNSELAALFSTNAPHAFGYVLDPSCGVASFLAEFIRALHSRSSLDRDEESRWLETLISDVVVGIDKSERMIRYALTNIAMFGIPATRLKLANALERPTGSQENILTGKVGLIITNPPFGAEFSAQDAFGSRIASASLKRGKVSSECLFMERYIEWLRPGGQLIAIVPDSILTNQGYFSTLRESLANDIDIKAVISLPQNTFAASGTTTKTSILHLRKRSAKHASPNRALVARCDDIGYEIITRNSHRVKRTKGAGELPHILKMISSSAPSGRSANWVHNLEEKSRWDPNFHLVTFAGEQSSQAKGEQPLRVTDVATLTSERHDPRRGTGTFQYIEISDVDGATSTCRAKEVSRNEAPSRARKLVRAGDVLVSTVRPERRTIGVVSSPLDGAICTTGFAVLRPKKGISPLALAGLLRTDFCTDQILRHNVGIAYPAIDERCLCDVVLPADRTALVELAKQASLIQALHDDLEAKRLEFSRMLSAVS